MVQAARRNGAMLEWCQQLLSFLRRCCLCRAQRGQYPSEARPVQRGRDLADAMNKEEKDYKVVQRPRLLFLLFFLFFISFMIFSMFSLFFSMFL